MIRSCIGYVDRRQSQVETGKALARVVTQPLESLYEGAKELSDQEILSEDFFNLPREEQKKILMNPPKPKADKLKESLGNFIPSAAVGNFLARVFDPTKDVSTYDAVDAAFNALPLIGGAIEIPLKAAKSWLKSSEYIRVIKPGTKSEISALLPTDKTWLKPLPNEPRPVVEVVEGLDNYPVPQDIDIVKDTSMPWSGAYSPKERLIKVNPRVSPAVQETFEHEFTHAIQHEVGWPTGTSQSIVERSFKQNKYNEVETARELFKRVVDRAGLDSPIVKYLLEQGPDDALIKLGYYRDPGEIAAFRAGQWAGKTLDEMIDSAVKVDDAYILTMPTPSRSVPGVLDNLLLNEETMYSRYINLTE